MGEPGVTEAIISIDSDGRYLDANAAALALLGVTLAELRKSSGDRFSMRAPSVDEQAALRAEWESVGSRPLVGTTGIRRADGTTIRVSYAVETIDPGFHVRLWEIPGSPDAPPSLFSVGEVLRSWRAAERELAELKPGTPEWTRTLSEIEMLRRQYGELFRTVHPQTGS